MKKIVVLIGCCMGLLMEIHAQPAVELLQKVREKIEKVKDYQAAGVMKTNVPFMKVPVADVTVYFKNPDKIKIKNDKGISLVPKGALSMSLNQLMINKDFTAIEAGKDNVNGIPVKIIKLLPVDENAQIALSTLYIDEARALILKARTTTRENGTYELVMNYGKWAAYALPEKAVFTFNISEYKLPKGITFDYDDGSKKKTDNTQVNSNKGTLEITYKDYKINQGLQDSVFK
ncbi:MAG: hypothetical protein INR73_23475 [Williamsia sp.]|nr:hypothetical protein [Williamsia sp.]